MIVWGGDIFPGKGTVRDESLFQWQQNSRFRLLSGRKRIKYGVTSVNYVSHPSLASFFWPFIVAWVHGWQFNSNCRRMSEWGLSIE